MVDEIFPPADELVGTFVRFLRNRDRPALRRGGGLISVLREHWEKIAEHTPLTEADVDRAERVAAEMTTAIGARENGVNRAPAVELSARASTKMLRVHEELRRMMTFLRWYEDDVDAFIPSLWANRGRKRRSSGDDVDTDREIDSEGGGSSPAAA